jgi:hypothetical protein
MSTLVAAIQDSVALALAVADMFMLYEAASGHSHVRSR